MKKWRIAKVITYPIFAVLQFFLAWKHGFPGALLFLVAGFGLIGVAILNWRRIQKDAAY